MFPIDSIFLIGILIVTTISAYVLILKKLRPKSILTDEIPTQDPKKHDLNARKKDKNMPQETLETTKPKKSRPSCSHHFGYLRTLPKNAALPDECLGCPKIIECLTRARTTKTPAKQK